MFQHILLPTDGSRLSEKSVQYGIQLAKGLNARVTALHVTPGFYPLGYEIVALEMPGDDFENVSAARARKYLGIVRAAAAKAGVPCDVVHAVSDYPFKEIIKTARRKKCDLILMASHGWHGLAGVLLGSETQKVLTHSRVPVLVYR